MKIEKVIVDVGDLRRDLREDGVDKYFASFSKYLSCAGKSDAIEYNLVTEADERFINLFGLSVGVESGDIALGLFPENDSYIRVGNIYDMINREMFRSKKRVLNDEDMRFILEELKLNPSMVSHRVALEIDNMLEGANVELKYNSIILNAISLRKEKNISSEVKRFIDKNDLDGLWVRKLITSCIDMYMDLEEVAREFFGNFISEDSSVDVLDKADKSVGEISKSRTPNMESLMLKYIKYNIPIELLYALKSYGFGIKQRKNLVSLAHGKYRVSSVNNDALFMVGESLSSLSYMEARYTANMTATYNILDLLKASGWEMNTLFSMEVYRTYKNRSMIERILSRFNIYEMLYEHNVTSDDFMKGIESYGDRFLTLVDRGCMYSRNVTMKQYSFLIYSRDMIRNSGRVFEKASEMVLKKF